MSDIDILLEEEMKNPEFCKAWEDTALEYQIKELMIEARISAGLTQKELSEKSGIRQSNISRIEKGVCIPTLKTLETIAKSLGKHIKISMV
ncbi:Helix-turn-helix [Lachnospiraceae bacterium NE2001]|nr:Helix-turn-helix [Lachnospiraceae bacterium NE2001]